MNTAIDWLPSHPPRPAPAVMTDEEASLYFRLHAYGADPAPGLAKLEDLINRGQLHPSLVGGAHWFSRCELERFVAEQTARSAERARGGPGLFDVSGGHSDIGKGLERRPGTSPAQRRIT